MSSVLIKETPESSLISSVCEKSADCNLEEVPHQNSDMLAPNLRVLASRTMRNKMSVVYKPQCLWYFVIAA